MGPGCQLQLLWEPKGCTISSKEEWQLRSPQEPWQTELLVQSGARPVTTVGRTGLWCHKIRSLHFQDSIFCVAFIDVLAVWCFTSGFYNTGCTRCNKGCVTKEAVAQCTFGGATIPKASSSVICGAVQTTSTPVITHSRSAKSQYAHSEFLMHFICKCYDISDIVRTLLLPPLWPVARN